MRSQRHSSLTTNSLISFATLPTLSFGFFKKKLNASLLVIFEASRVFYNEIVEVSAVEAHSQKSSHMAIQVSQLSAPIRLYHQEHWNRATSKRFLPAGVHLSQLCAPVPHIRNTGTGLHRRDCRPLGFTQFGIYING
ncbi:hypothetical protein TNIN_34201 [Trichonephila inaurata madagascariensis]|uniref:Uncharacterized protein n=1 Tax=Trichonephila inaurata madagascariensis TaxID=2747483 RepID=A0A8X6XTA1_9ARAC|nr:hypothetical protein TNIN_34201 [Trichonephila inaurata madagascariensis]